MRFQKRSTTRLIRLFTIVFLWPIGNAKRDSEAYLRMQVRGNHCEFVDSTTAERNARRTASMMASEGRQGQNTESNNGRQTVADCVFDQANRIACNASTFFREPSGRCNNLQHKTWGMAGTAFRRARPAAYDDGFQAVRTAGLPNARAVSTAVTRTNDVLDDLGFSMQLMQWGQYLAHEVTAIREADLDAICCPDKLFASENPRTRSAPNTVQLSEARNRIQTLRGDICIAIERANDPIYNKDVCMTQVRSTAAPLEDCSASPRQQMNTATHFVDGSAIYGSSTAAHTRLRSRRDGKLKSQFVSGAELPPRDFQEDCQSPPRCPFDAGDRRVNTTPNLASTHILFLRKHNEIAAGLKAVNPRWDDERLFQESRRIVIGIQQNIHYNEWLQILLGDKLDKYSLRKSTTSNFRNLYSGNVHPGLLNELATAAMRFGHTTVGAEFTVGNSEFDLTEHFENPELVYTRGTGQCLGGLAIDRPGKFDKFFAEPMRDSLFDSDLDIVSLNINRGRDHGLGSYVQYRRHYGLSIPNSFRDMLRTHPSDVVADFERIYGHVSDIDLYIGGVTENKLRDGFLGPLFAEILADGYKRLRDGDRFYFEGQGSGFTLDQLNSIRRYTYAKLICENGGVSRIPRDAFRRASRSNPSVSCSTVLDVNLNLWAERSRTTPTTARPSSCRWITVRRTECCNGRRTITRECQGHSPCTTSSWYTRTSRLGYKQTTRRCEGGSSCRQGSSGCSGSTITYEACDCLWYDSSCQLTGCNGPTANTRRPPTAPRRRVLPAIRRPPTTPRRRVPPANRRPPTTPRRRVPPANRRPPTTPRRRVPPANRRPPTTRRRRVPPATRRPTTSRCHWRNISVTECYNGVQTTTRICEGDFYCRDGFIGCPGDRSVTTYCNIYASRRCSSGYC